MREKVNTYLALHDNKENLKKLFLLYLLVLCLTHGEIHVYVKMIIGLSSFIGIIIPGISSKLIFWVFILMSLIFNLYFSYSYSSNHFFLATYTVGAVIIERIRSKSKSAPLVNSYRSLLILTFGLATLQKIISPYFLSGRLIASYILGGGSFYEVLSFINPNHEALVYSYYDTTMLAKSEPFLTSFPISMPGENFILVCIILSFLIIAFEILLFTLSANSKYFYHPKFAWILIGFVWITFTFRQEYAFFALLIILFLLSVDNVKGNPGIVLKLNVFVLLVLDLTKHLTVN